MQQAVELVEAEELDRQTTGTFLSTQLDVNSRSERSRKFRLQIRNMCRANGGLCSTGNMARCLRTIRRALDLSFKRTDGPFFDNGRVRKQRSR